MNYLTGFTVLLLLQLVGEVSSRTFNIPIPGPVIGMALLFILLCVLKRVPKSIETASLSLLNHFSLLFIPAGVGIMLYFDELHLYWLPIVMTVLITTVLTLAATGLCLQISAQKTEVDRRD